jgi:dihydroxyacetone kinase-like predicted kinase
MPDPRLSADAPPDLQDAAIADVLERAVAAGQESVKRGPELLPVLREAGVVDAGGHALTVIFAGVVAVLRGAEPPEIEHHAPARVTHPQHDSSTFQYCTNFVVTGEGLDAARYRRELEALGDSVLVVGDLSTLKVHVHTDDPEAATALFAQAQSVTHLDVADMRQQMEERSERLLSRNGGEEQARCGALAVVSGDGMKALFDGLGVQTLDGGPTLNPSTYDLLAGMHAVPAEQVVVLPNSPNVIMAAERAAGLSDKQVRVVPTRSQQAGLAVAVALERGRDAQANAASMAEQLACLRTGAVAPAARDDAGGRFRAGEAVGFVEDEIVAWGEPEPTLRAVLVALGSDAELLTCISGEGAPLDGEHVRDLAPEGVEFEQSVGGQPAYWWLLASE